MRALVGAVFAAVMVGLAALTALGTFHPVVEGETLTRLEGWVPLAWLVVVPAALVAVGYFAGEGETTRN